MPESVEKCGDGHRVECNRERGHDGAHEYRLSDGCIVSRWIYVPMNLDVTGCVHNPTMNILGAKADLRPYGTVGSEEAVRILTLDA
jgi:hypothetical protein